MTTQTSKQVPQHGTTTRYNHGCHCTHCTTAMNICNTAARNDRILGKPRRVNALGSHRRITALMANGWPGHAIADLSGVPIAVIQRMSSHSQPHISRRYAHAIAAAYRRIGLATGPSATTTNRALARGWPVPEQWDGQDLDDPAARPRDDSAVADLLDMHTHVEQAIAGRLGYDLLTSSERAAAIARLNKAGFNDAQIAHRLHSRHATIGKRRDRMGLPANADNTGYLAGRRTA